MSGAKPRGVVAATALMVFVATMFAPVREPSTRNVPGLVVRKVECFLGLRRCHSNHGTSPQHQAVFDLKVIGSGVAQYVETRIANRGPDAVQYLFPEDVGPTPATDCCGQTCSGSWADPVWREQIRFQPTQPSQYQYRVNRLGDRRAVVTARGDLDCDGITSEFTLTVTVDSGGWVTESPVTYTNYYE